ncbi:MAG: hypothetical protein COV67_06295 [Nitrospinae bacterium CG11_big_fil_rev_8_21_14_0_20_56_8]|nr:MAG: hypothetical protein COV67_06295 [Nitrospinae bacterium CG11_big_fil_rev_8_21_14_0_20_56_8]
MKRFFRNLGWVCLGIFLQFKFSVLYGIVFLENLNFHERTYFIQMHIPPSEEKVKLLQIKTTVHHSLGPDYFANIYISEDYRVLNKEPYLGAETMPGFKAYQMDMKRKYRDVLSTEDFILVPLKDDIPPTPIWVHFENLRQRLHSDSTYRISTTQQKTRLEGPEQVEAKYPQKWNM